MQLDTQAINPDVSRNMSTADPTGKTKQNITTFLGKDGQADTTVHETINPAVVNEHIRRASHEERQKIIDREVHQDHHHISVQPIREQQILPETHEHNMIGVETREIEHGDERHVREKLAAERAMFHDTHDVEDDKMTTSTGPTVAGEHIHHHVYETIQPVVEREVIQPKIIHTTIPIHEVHHNEPKHHTASALPEVTMAQFQAQGGTLGGRAERTDSFSGAPRAIGDAVTERHHSNVLGGPGAAGTTTVTGSHRYGGGNEGYSTQDQGYAEESPSTMRTSNKQTTRDYEYEAPRQQQFTDSTGSTTGEHTAMGAGAAATGLGGAGTAADMASGGTRGLGSAAQSKHVGGNNESWMGKGSKAEKGAEEAAPAKKASIIDKLNPLKDTEGASVKPGFL